MRKRFTLRAIVLENETTTLSPETGELISLALRAVAVERFSGRVTSELGSYFGRQEPQAPMSVEAEAITGLSKEILRGQRFQHEAVNALLQGCQLVVSHNAGFDRPFVERELPQFIGLPWACSMTEIDWRGQESQPSAALDHLYSLHGLTTDGTLEGECRTLARLLELPLPVSPWNGFVQLIDASEVVEYELRVPDPRVVSTADLVTLGFELDPASDRWRKRFRDEADVQQVAGILGQLLADSPVRHIESLRIDAECRHSGRLPEARVIHLRD